MSMAYLSTLFFLFRLGGIFWEGNLLSDGPGSVEEVAEYERVVEEVEV